MDSKVLIVEDEPKLREVLCDYFRSKGESPAEARDGVEALAPLEETEFDAILLDIMMPGLDGRSVCRAVRRTSGVPIIFLTALSDEEDKLLGYELGVDDYVTRYIDVILSEAERTDGMVLELLDLSRLEAGKVKLSRDGFSLTALTQSVFEKLEMASKEKNLEIALSFPEEVTVTADESRIAQVVENFATNAIKYTPEGGHIAVAVERTRTGAAWTVENESEPLTQEALERVWDAFYRADEARTGGGTGLGLAIAKSIIELHGGTCFARNTASGVAFGFTI